MAADIFIERSRISYVRGLAFSAPMPETPPRCCRGSGVEHPLGKGEVESSNLSGSTIDIPLGRNVAPKLLILLDAR